MKLRLLVLLACLIGMAYYFFGDRLRVPPELKAAVESAIPPMPMPQTEPEAVYRWKDAQGRTHYGSEVPKGMRGELASGGTVTSVQMPKLPKVEPVQSDPLQGKSLHELATERAIEQSTR